MVSYDALSDTVITAIFAVVSFQFLFPGNYFIPLDRRLSGLLGAVLCAMVAYLMPESASIAGEHVDIEVLVILVSIMVINFVLMQQTFVESYIFALQESIKSDPNLGFWLVSLASFFISPFVTNDGLCLLLVNPVLDALQVPTQDKSAPPTHASLSNQKLTATNIVSNRFYFMLTISSSSNIGSVMTFAGNPQNIIIAKTLIDLMSGGLFFGLMLIPATVVWFLTVLHMNNCRIIATKKDAEVAASGGEIQPHTLATALLGPIVEVDENDDRTIASSGQSKQDANALEETNKNSFSIESGLRSSAPSSDRGGAPRNTSVGGASSIPTSFLRTSSRTRESSTNVSSHRNTNRLTSASVGSVRMTSVGSSGRQSYMEHLSQSVRRSSISEAISGGMSLVVQGVYNVSNAGAVTYISFALFALLIVIELANLAELVLVFAIVAVLMVVVVVLVSYYTGQPRANSKGKPISNAERREGIEMFVNEMFLDIDYNLIIIFVGKFLPIAFSATDIQLSNPYY